MFISSEVITAFVAGWMVCVIPLLLGGWRDKIETRLRDARNKRRCSKCSCRPNKGEAGATASGGYDEVC